MSTSKYCPRTWIRFRSCQCEHLIDPFWTVDVWKTPYFALWQGTWGSPMEAQGLSFTQMRLLEGKCSLCIENKNGTGLFIGCIPKWYYNQALRLYSMDGWHLKPSIDGTNEFKTDYSDTNVCLVTGQYSWSVDHTNGTWNSSAVSLVDLPDAPGYKGANQNSGMTWAGNDTYLYSCQNWTEGLHHQKSHNPLCSDHLTEARGNCRCADASITDNMNGRPPWTPGSNLVGPRFHSDLVCEHLWSLYFMCQ